MKITRVLIDTFKILLERRTPILKAIFIPCLIIIATNLLILNYIDVHFVISIFFFTLSIAAYIYIAVIVHRSVLIGSNSVPIWGIARWTQRETSFLFMSFGVGIIAFIPSLFLYALLSYFEISTSLYIIIIPGYYLFSRLSLVFPSIAIDKEISISHSWKLTQNNQILLLLVVAVIPIIIQLPSDYIPETLITTPLLSIYNCMTEVVIIACLSRAYHSCIEQGSGDNANQSPEN